MRMSILAGKAGVEQFYGQPHRKAYYIGCSEGDLTDPFFIEIMISTHNGFDLT